MGAICWVKYKGCSAPIGREVALQHCSSFGKEVKKHKIENDEERSGIKHSFVNDAIL